MRASVRRCSTPCMPWLLSPHLVVDVGHGAVDGDRVLVSADPVVVLGRDLGPIAHSEHVDRAQVPLALKICTAREGERVSGLSRWEVGGVEERT